MDNNAPWATHNLTINSPVGVISAKHVVLDKLSRCPVVRSAEEPTAVALPSLLWHPFIVGQAGNLLHASLRSGTLSIAESSLPPRPIFYPVYDGLRSG